MAATPGSVYQALAAQHRLGNPPNTDYQRFNESYSPDYIARMASAGCLPDINPTESDSDYVARLASYSYAPPPSAYVSASYAVVAEEFIPATDVAAVASASYAASASWASNVVGGYASETLKIEDNLGNPVTMSFVNGILTNVQ